MIWNGRISLNGTGDLEDVAIHGEPGVLPLFISETASIRFLSVVETSRIPLYLIVGSPCDVHTTNAHAERWFNSILCPNTPKHEDEVPAWWETAKPDSPLGILVSVDDQSTSLRTSSSHVTELLFYATQDSDNEPRRLTPPASSPHDSPATPTRKRENVRLQVVALSSDLLHRAQHDEPTPPASPIQQCTEDEAVFLPRQISTDAEVVNHPPVRKRRSAADAFDEASERRRKARRKGGEGVAAAAADRSDSQVPTLKHRRSVSNTQNMSLQNGPLSRSPSVCSSRPPTANPSGPKRSALSRAESVAELPLEPTTESRNKEIISRIVMAGMRLYGLSQRKSKMRRSLSVTGKANEEWASALTNSRSNDSTEQKQDEEYKLIYHQAFKGTCFAFRSSVNERSLQPFSEAVREVVDRLLGLFCNDPLANGLASVWPDKLTPGGRKAFGSNSASDANCDMLTSANAR